jgi:hypothetical protein
MLRNSLLVLGLVIVTQGIPAAAGQTHSADRHRASEAAGAPNTESGSGEHYYCRILEMPISWAMRGRPVDIVHSDAVFHELGTTVPALDVRDTRASPITNLAFVVEYLDSQGHKATTAAIAAAAAGYEKSAHLPFSVENIEVWKEPLEPGKTARVSGFYDSVRTTTCPVAGRISFVMARFKDGTVQQYAADGWSVPPLPRFVPELTAACPAVQKDPTEIRAKLRLSSTGDVIGISGPVLAKDNPDQVAWVATQMKRWTFQPALLDGRPHEVDLDVEFVLYGDPEPNLAAISPASPATLIVFFPRKDSSGGCVESFGFLREAMTIP